MLAEENESTQQIGISVQQAEEIAVKNILWIAGGSVAVIYLIYKFLIK